MDYERVARSLVLAIAVAVFAYVALSHVSKYFLIKTAEGKL